MGSQSLQHRSREQQYEGNMNKVTIQQYQPPLPIQIPSSQSSRAPQTGRCLIQTKGQRSTDAYQEQVGACLHKVMLWKIFLYPPLAHSSMREPGAALPRARQSREVGCAAQHQGMALIFLAWPRNAGTEVPDHISGHAEFVSSSSQFAASWLSDDNAALGRSCTLTWWVLVSSAGWSCPQSIWPYRCQRLLEAPDSRNKAQIQNQNFLLRRVLAVHASCPV